MSTIIGLESTITAETNDCTLAKLYEQFGPMLFHRIRQVPAPGTGTEDDVLALNDHEDRLCELVDGILVEKTMGQHESSLALHIAWLLMNFVKPRKLGTVFGADGFMKLRPGLVRIPDACFVCKARMKAAKLRPWSKLEPLVPDLAVEVLSPGNTKKEMDDKLVDYFEAGVQLVWYVNPHLSQVTVYRGVEQFEILKPPAELSGDPVLPGLKVSLTELFAPPEEE